MNLWSNVARLVVGRVKNAHNSRFDWICPPLPRVQQLSCGIAHLLGVVLGNVRVGEFLRHGCGCVCVVCDMWRDDKKVSVQERMCES